MYKNVSLVAVPKQDLIRPPAAIPILAASCEQLGIEYNINDFNLWLYRNVSIETWNSINDNWESVNPFANRNQPYYQVFQEKLNEFVKIILSQHSDLIAISVFSDISAHCAVELITEINQHVDRNRVHIVIGGSGIRAMIFDSQELCQYLLRVGLIDYFIFGEGEIAFNKLLLKDYQYPGINNFNAVQIDDLNQFPFPSYKKINPADYNYVESPEIMITGSRGCVRKCTYCDVARYWPKFRYRDGQCIADELYYYYKTYDLTNFEFSDSLINGSLKQFRAMNRALIQYQKIDPTFKISFKGQYICRAADQVKEQDYAEMKQAGCDYLYVGVESFSNQVRHDMDKKFNNSDLDFHLQMTGKYGIKNSFLMIVGYPTETPNDHAQNLETLRKYQHYAQADVISMIVFGYTANILADTPLFHMQDQLNIVPEYDSNNGFNTFNWISLNNPSLNLVERIRRWTELIELADQLGYSMPRNQHYILRFIDVMEELKTRNIKILQKM
jgi:radical SAM superfamily enzyme YgiQ (UPF0313 family)